jgi:uncharacterized membrane protein YgcG
VFGRERLFLKRTFEASHVILAEAGEGGLQEMVRARYRLPARADGGNATATWYTDGLRMLPRRVRAATVEQERMLYEALVGELRTGMALDIDNAPSFDRAIRERAAEPAVGDGGYLIIGDGNARRLHAAMEKCGKAATLIHLGEFRIIRGAGETVAAKIREAVAERRPAAIVLQLLDYTVFEALTEDGDKMPPRRIDDKIHLEGDIKVCERAVLEKILKLCRPMLDATAGINTVLIGPMPRYISAACCDDATHMPNRRRAAFLEEMKGDLAAANKVIKDFLFNDDYTNVRAMDPWMGLRSTPLEELWGPDPVHIKECHMHLIIKGVDLTLAKIKPKRRRESDAGGGHKRGRSDSADRGARGRGRGGYGGGRGRTGGGGSFSSYGEYSGGGGHGGAQSRHRGNYGGY